MSLPENMPSPGMDSPYILRLLYPDRNADRNARAFPGPGVFRSTTSGVAALRHRSTTSEVAAWRSTTSGVAAPRHRSTTSEVAAWRSTTSGVAAPRHRSTTSEVAVSEVAVSPAPLESPGVNHLWGHWHLGGRWRSTTSEVAVSPARPVAGTNHQILIYIFLGMC